MKRQEAQEAGIALVRRIMAIGQRQERTRRLLDAHRLREAAQEAWATFHVIQGIIQDSYAWLDEYADTEPISATKLREGIRALEAIREPPELPEGFVGEGDLLN